MYDKLPVSVYQDHEVTRVARKILGKQLWTNFNNQLTGGLIVEVEAYCGATDSACHAFPDKRTPRTSIMFKKGGIAYVYLVYGMHHLFNIVTNVSGKADAVLVRAIEPLTGEKIMQQRRNIFKTNKLLTGGPGKLSQALGITTLNNSTDLSGDEIWLSEGVNIKKSDIVASPRIGVEYAGEDALLPWRFHIRDNKFVSK